MGKNEGSLNILYTNEGYIFDNLYENDMDNSFAYLYGLYCECPERFLYVLSFHSLKNCSISLQLLCNISRFCLKTIVESPEFRFNRIRVVSYDEFDCKTILNHIPMVLGYQNIDKSWIYRQYSRFADYFMKDISESGLSTSEFISKKGIDSLIPSRIYFHLVENNDVKDYPFAFMATYTTENEDKVIHIPLKNALNEFKNNKKALENLISCITNASEDSRFIKSYLENGEIFFPIRMNEQDAYSFLKDVPTFERYGIVCRIPKWYIKRESKILVDIEEKKMFGGYLSVSGLSSFSPKLIYNGVEITIDEAKKLLAKSEGLELLKGKWVEVNHDDLMTLIEEYEDLSKDGTTLKELLYYKSSLLGRKNDENIIPIEFSKEDWYLSHQSIGTPYGYDEGLPKNYVGVLRPYQIEAFSWLWRMCCFGFGVCLADDMGLGKTVEVLSFIKKYKIQNNGHILLIVPAILVSNWINEIEKFDSEIDYFVLKGNNCPEMGRSNTYLTITTYQIALRSEYISSLTWDMVIVDEAQAIKNYYTGQTKKIKSLKSNIRIAMTGTPIENNALDLWSIFDFINPGFLGKKDEFLDFYFNNEDSNSRIKELIQPFVLRRLKTDKSIIRDLPDKNEIDVSINMTPKQIVLYRKIVQEMNDRVSINGKTDQNAVVLSTIIRLKQLCNHPSQYLGDSNYLEEDSGKFIALREICETIIAKREKVIIFTQFKEIIQPLVTFINNSLKIHGDSIDGSTSMNKRAKIISDFQEGKLPFLVLSIKTAGVGINLTAAQNVILFDRWWNPAVENQAIDRAYRIGQVNNVNVYKFITADSIEMIINDILKNKQKLADEIINDLDKEVTSNITIDELVKAISYDGG